MSPTSRRDPIKSLAMTASKQHGVFTRKQAHRAGVTRAMIETHVRKGEWVRAMRGVYRIAGAPQTWKGTLMTACLACAGVASHRAAAALWHLPAFAEGIVEVIVHRKRKARPSGAAEHWVGPLPPSDVVRVDGIPVTTPARTLVDIAGLATAELLEEALDDALRRNLVTIPRLRWQLAKSSSRGRKGVGLLKRMLEVRAPASPKLQSVLETRAWRLLRREGLGDVVRQHRIRDGTSIIAVVDFAFPGERVAIEVDGRAHHSSRRSWERDLARRNRITAPGWRVLHFTAEDARQPARFLQAVRRARRDASRGGRSVLVP